MEKPYEFEQELMRLQALTLQLFPNQNAHVELDRTSSDWYVKILVGGAEKYVCPHKTLHGAISGVKSELLEAFSQFLQSTKNQVSDRERELRIAQSNTKGHEALIERLHQENNDLTVERNSYKQQIEKKRKR